MDQGEKRSSQDATLITSDLVHGKHDESCNKGETVRSEDESLAKKNNKTHFVYK